jgi:hypothetical protein
MLTTKNAIVARFRSDVDRYLSQRLGVVEWADLFITTQVAERTGVSLCFCVVHQLPSRFGWMMEFRSEAIRDDDPEYLKLPNWSPDIAIHSTVTLQQLRKLYPDPATRPASAKVLAMRLRLLGEEPPPQRAGPFEAIIGSTQKFARYMGNGKADSVLVRSLSDAVGRSYMRVIVLDGASEDVLDFRGVLALCRSLCPTDRVYFENPKDREKQ